MNKLHFLQLLVFTILFSSCVNRIDIPEEEEAKFFISIEMLQSSPQIVAEFRTSNNLNGTNPILKPTNGIINIKQKGVDADLALLYDEESGKYISANNTTEFLKFGQTYNLTASIDDSEIEAIKSSTKVPFRTFIDEYELISEDNYTDLEGNEFWQGNVGLQFSSAINFEERFAHLHLTGSKTLKEVMDGEVFYTMEGDTMYFELIDVVEGRSAVTDIVHREGFFVELDELDNNYLEIIIRSSIPITSENQVVDFLDAEVISVSKEHYNYHIALHNIQSTQDNIFVEDALYNSNITNGLGLFSSCVPTQSTLSFK